MRSSPPIIVVAAALLGALVACQRVEGAGPTSRSVAEPASPTSRPGLSPSERRPSTTPSATSTSRPSRRSPDQSYHGNTRLSGAARVRTALRRGGPVVRRLLRRARLPLKPRALLFRVYKKEEELEVWAQGRARSRYRKVATYRICSTSGDLGPKKKEGDGQVPEGFYTLDFYHPRSTYYLAMRIDYPNRHDRRHGYTGSAIMIHGNCVSIGCLAMTDARIEELWAFTHLVRKRRRVRVHLYPRRDLAAAIRGTKDKALARFWRTLQRGHAYFDRHGRPPRISLDRQRRYRFR